MLLTIYTPVFSPRIQYIFGWIFTQILGIDIRWIYSLDEYLISESPKIAYSDKWVDGGYWFGSSGLLTESGIVQQHIEPIYYNDLLGLFGISDTRSELPFDMFSSAFYLISRYEEYLSSEVDIHDRFTSRASVAYQYGFLMRPLVNEYIAWLRLWLHQRFPKIDLLPIARQYQMLLDIDHPLLFRFTSPIRSLYRRLKHLNFGQKGDPYDNYAFIAQVAQSYHWSIQSFALCPATPGGYDLYTVRNTAYGSWLRQISQMIPMGIHPSYDSAYAQRVSEEQVWLAQQLGYPVIDSRFHYLRIPVTRLASAYSDTTILRDYSLMYADTAGFRTGTSIPYYWYDLNTELITQLEIITPCWMDATYKYYTPDLDPVFIVEQLFRTISLFGGRLVLCFHNDLLATKEQQQQMLRIAMLTKYNI